MSKKYKQQSNILEDLFIGIFKIIGMFFAWLFRLIFQKQKSPRYSGGSSVVNISERWTEVEQLLTLHGTSHINQAVLLADNLVDAKLKQMGISGETMGERLKNSNKNFQWDELQALWNLHKLRNEIAHNPNAEILHHQAEQVINSVKRIIL